MKKVKTPTKKTTVKKTLTNLIILDASGSMSGNIPEVRGGLKQIFSDIKKNEKTGKTNIVQKTIITDFSGAGDFNVLVNSKTSGTDLKDELADSYNTRGMTALYDAIYKSFALVPKTEKNVFVSIFTDGAENDSKEFKSPEVKKLIADKKKLGWAITFIGANEEAATNATSLGISGTMSGTSGVSGAAGQSGTSGWIGLAQNSYYAAVSRTASTDSIDEFFTENLLESVKNQK